MARHGENIRKREDGRWEGRYKVFDDKKGEYRYRSVYGRDYGEVKEKLSRARLGLVCRDSEEGYMQKEGRWAAGEGTASVFPAGGSGCVAGNNGGRNDGKVLFSQAAGEWLVQVRSRRKYSTYIKYEIIYRTHLDGTVGSCQLSADRARELQEKISDHLSGRGASESLQKSVICVANQILIFANEKYSSGIPRLERPLEKTKKKDVGTFSRPEQAKLLDRICESTDKFMVAVLLCLCAGLRLGELCALRWTDIDFEGMTLTVSRTVQRIAMPGYMTRTVLLETEPKSESSRRTIPLTPEILALLMRFRGEQPYVFGGKKPLDPRTMQYRFKKILKEAGIADRNFHTLRHTFATNCVENGMDVKVLSELLGHSDVKITLNRYVHPTMDSKRRQIGALLDFYGQICGQVA